MIDDTLVPTDRGRYLLITDRIVLLIDLLDELYAEQDDLEDILSETDPAWLAAQQEARDA